MLETQVPGRNTPDLEFIPKPSYDTITKLFTEGHLFAFSDSDPLSELTPSLISSWPELWILAKTTAGFQLNDRSRKQILCDLLLCNHVPVQTCVKQILVSALQAYYLRPRFTSMLADMHWQ